MCVCVCVRERERERGIKQKTKQKKRNGRPHPADLVDVDDPMAGALTRLLFFSISTLTIENEYKANIV